VFSYIGDETWNELSAKHVPIYQVQQGLKEAQHLSTMDFYLDPTSLLLLGITYKTHADNNMNADISSEVRFDDYRLTNGIEVPFHILPGLHRDCLQVHDCGRALGEGSTMLWLLIMGTKDQPLDVAA
jgi:hypothetical protein